jgi:DNA-binding transcriptional regulator PaaX
MDYNKLKIMVLKTLDKSEGMNFHELLTSLKESPIINPKALQMALLRYCRQGLLQRRKHGRYYRYKITERGKSRLNWLRDVVEGVGGFER